MLDATSLSPEPARLARRGKAGCGTLGVVVVDARVERVRSLPRSQFLRDARGAHGRGELAPGGLKAAEDRAVTAVEEMRNAGG
jgi:hypothetical protein